MSAASSVRSSGDPNEETENAASENNNNNVEDDASTSSDDDDNDSGDSNDDDDSDSDSDSDDSDKDDSNSRGDGDDASSKEPKGNTHVPLIKLPPVARPSPLQHPKMRIKLTLKLPTKANAPPRSDDRSENDDDDVKATVVESDDDDEEGASVTAVVAEESSSQPTTTKEASLTTSSKRRSINPSKPIKMPPIQSPGLLMVPPNHPHANNGPKFSSNSSSVTNALPCYSIHKDGFTTPASVFGETMKLAGYCHERRTNVPHRGSSVERVVDDMFDSHVQLALHIPPFVPPGLFRRKDAESVDDEVKKERNDLVQSMIEALQPDTNEKGVVDATKSSRKRRRPWSFKEMIPVSLTMTFPREYVEKRKAYIQQVHERERAIVRLQEVEEHEQLQGNMGNAEKRNTVIPPIPSPPSPPHLSECTKDDSDLKDMYNDEAHPIYIPNGRERCVAHLDEDCFHITKGRYFGLISNMIADPNFVGPNAPGIAGVSASAGAGLATSTTGTTATALTATSFQNVTATAVKPEVKRKSLDTSPKKNGPNDASEDIVVARDITSGSKPHNNSNELKRGKEAGEAVTESTRTEIIKAAIHAARSNLHGQSFAAANGQSFSDVSKAFALYAGIKPCERCKSNKQGVRLIIYVSLFRNDWWTFCAHTSFSCCTTALFMPLATTTYRT